MPCPGAVLALLAGLAPMQLEGKELVALPLSEEGVKPPAGLDAWKSLIRELEKRGRRLGLSTALQKKRHDFLIGPAREQGRDCGSNAECLAEIGAALGGDILVAGTVSKSRVTVYAVDVATAKQIGKAHSPSKLARRPLAQKARVAARVLMRALSRLAKEPKKAEVAAAPPKTPPEEAPSERVESKPEDEAVTEAPAPPPRATEGRILIPKEQLSGVSRVTIDGTQLYFSGDGSMRWTGATGAHTLIAERNDGNRLKKDVVVEPDEATEVSLVFPPAALPPPPAPSVEVKPRETNDVFGAWWFWTSVGAAVVAGTTTAALLAGGAKGGPSLEGNTGTIRGSY